MGEHALISASGASRWFVCPPSVRLAEHEPENESDYAAEGTLAHDICEQLLRYNYGVIVKSTFNKKLATFRKHEMYSKEMLEHCEGYAAFIWERTQALTAQGIGFEVLIEQKVHYGHIAQEGFGTCDCIIVYDGGMDVIDFKYGKGVLVSAEKNKQMLLYALGAFAEFDMMYAVDSITMTIVQPRLGNYSSWTISPEELKEEGCLLKEKADLAWEGVGEMVSGDHCRFCKIKNTCKKLAEDCLHIFDKSSLINTPEDIAKILPMLDIMQSWIKTLKDTSLTNALNGKPIPGYKVVQGRSVRRINDLQGVVNSLVALGTEETVLYKDRELISLTDMQKLVGKKVITELEKEGLITKSEGKPALVPISDKREAITDNAADDFSEFVERGL